MSVETRVLSLLRTKPWVSNEELENLFPKGAEGHYSWPQRLRGLRDKGYIINRRIKAGTKNLSEWNLQELRHTIKNEQVEMTAEHNFHIETPKNKQAEFAGMRRVNYGV